MLRGRSKSYRPYNPQQQFLLPPSLQDRVPEDHLARFTSDVVESLDLGAIYPDDDRKDARGTAPYHPVMMVKLLVYGYCTGVRSSRRVERATFDDVAFRFLAADQHPDHASISEFRRRHLEALANLFAQGAPSLPKGGTGQARSRLLGRQQGQGQCQQAQGDELRPHGRERNFTDPESRIMVDGATKGFVQGYNAQAVVDGSSRIIVACDLTQQAVDSRQPIPMLERVAEDMNSRKHAGPGSKSPKRASRAKKAPAGKPVDPASKVKNVQGRTASPFGASVPPAVGAQSVGARAVTGGPAPGSRRHWGIPQGEAFGSISSERLGKEEPVR